MCFLKTLKPLDQIVPYKDNAGDSSPEDFPLKNQQPNSFFLKLLSSKTPTPFAKHDSALFNLINLVNANSSNIHKLQKKINVTNSIVDEALNSLRPTFPSTEEIFKESTAFPPVLAESAKFDKFWKGEALVEKLFGKQEYKYKLQLTEELPAIVFKERNLSFGVKLVNKKNEAVMNSNIIHLCLGVADARGEWVSSNKSGDPFMKGKTEIEIYHGEGNFLRVYPRDVSRNYASGKLNFVIYSKPSMLKFSSNASSLEQHVSSEDIEPLLIKDLQIKAKKKDEKKD